MTDSTVDGLHAQVIFRPVANTVVRNLYVEVLVGPPSTPAIVNGISVDVLQRLPWATDVEDPNVVIQRLHPDGIWRPVYPADNAPMVLNIPQ